MTFSNLALLRSRMPTVESVISGSLILLLSSACSAIEQPDTRIATIHDPSAKVIPRLQLKAGEVAHVVYELRSHGVRVCYQSVRFDQDDKVVDTDRGTEFFAKGLVSLDAKESTVAKILDDVVSQDPHYTWRQLEGSDVIVVRPKQSRLDWRLTTPLPKEFVLGDLFKFSDVASHEVVPSTSGNANPRSSPYFEQVKLASNELTFERLLERIVTNDDRLVWSATVGPRITTLRFEYVQVGAPQPVRRPTRNVVADRIEGSWEPDTELNRRLNEGKVEDIGTLKVTIDPKIAEHLPSRFSDALKERKMEIYTSGKVVVRGVERPFVLTAVEGTPHLFYFRERGGDPLGDMESFFLTIVPAGDPKNDLLFVGGDSVNYPYRAYKRRHH